ELALRGFRFTRLRAALVGLWLCVLVAGRLLAARVDWSGDDRALSAWIRSIAPEPCREIVFVEEAPRLGLSFYLDAEVGEVSLEGSPDTESLGRELGHRDEEPRLWAVPAGHVGRFVEISRSFGYEMHELGRLPGHNGFVLLCSGST